MTSVENSGPETCRLDQDTKIEGINAILINLGIIHKSAFGSTLSELKRDKFIQIFEGHISQHMPKAVFV